MKSIAVLVMLPLLLLLSARCMAVEEMTLFDFANDQNGFYSFKNDQSRLTLSHTSDAADGKSGSLKADFRLVGDSAYGGIGVGWDYVSPQLSQWAPFGQNGALLLQLKASSVSELEVKLLAKDTTFSLNVQTETVWAHFALPFRYFRDGTGRAFDPTADKLAKLEIRPSRRNADEWLMIDRIAVCGDLSFEPRDQSFTVAGTVTTADDTPLANAEIEVQSEHKDVCGWFPVETMRTQADGHFAQKFVTRRAKPYQAHTLDGEGKPVGEAIQDRQLDPPAPYVLEVVRSGFCTYRTPIDLSAPANYEKLRITLRPVEQVDASITVSLNEKIREINPLVYGANVGLWHAWDFTNPKVIEATREAGITIIRYPGGARSQGARWQRQEAPWNAMPADGTKDGYNCVLTPASVSSFMDFCKQVGSEAMFSLNLESRDLENAADLVRFLNEEKKYGVKYFEFGNEPECYAEHWGFGKNWTHDRETLTKTYVEVARVHREFDAMLKKIDPQALSMGPVSANADFYDLALPPFWERVGESLPVLSVHRYPQTDQRGNAHFSDDRLLNAPMEWRALSEQLTGMQKKYAPGRRPLLAVTEWNTCYHTPGPRQQQIVGALFVARNLGEMITHGVDIANLWTLTGCGVYNLFNLNAKGEVEKPLPFHTFRLFARHLRGTLVRTESPDPMLSVYAARQEKNLAVILVNTSPEKSYCCRLNTGEIKCTPRTTQTVERTTPFTEAKWDKSEFLVPAYSTVLVECSIEE